jgi:type I restriction enzyme S subunit
LNEEFYELPPSWIWVKLGEISTIVGGGTPRRDNPCFYEDGTIPWATPTDVDPRNIVIVSKTKEKITEEAVKRSAAKVIPPGTVLFSSRASIGKIAIAGTELATNQGFANIIPTEVTDSKYLAYGLRNFTKDIERLGSGTTYLEVAKSSLKEFHFPLAPLNEQKRIVGKVEALFAESKTAREALDKVPVLLQRFRQSVLAKAFRGELTQRDPNDEPAKELLKRIRQERKKGRQKALVESQEQPSSLDLPGLPETWIWTSLSEVCTKIQDGTHFSPPNFQDLRDGVPYITAKNIRPNRIDLSQITYVSKSTHEGIYKRCDPVKGDIIYIKDGATTGLAVINELDYPFSMLSSLALLKPDKKIVDGRYLKHYLNSPEAFRRMIGKMTGTAIKRIILKRIKTAEFPLAPLTEQGRMVVRIEEMFALADQVEFAMKKAKKRADSIDQAILAKAFRGELIPQDPRDEPASTLLEHMRATYGLNKSRHGKLTD